MTVSFFPLSSRWPAGSPSQKIADASKGLRLRLCLMCGLWLFSLTHINRTNPNRMHHTRAYSDCLQLVAQAHPIIPFLQISRLRSATHTFAILTFLKKWVARCHCQLSDVACLIWFVQSAWSYLPLLLFKNQVIGLVFYTAALINASAMLHILFAGSAHTMSYLEVELLPDGRT